MKRLVVAIAAAIILAAAILFLVIHRAAPTPPGPAMSVSIVSVDPTTIGRKDAAVTFRLRLRVKGITLDAAHIGGANVRSHGHIQVYVNSIPTDAYVRKDLTQHWLASLAGTSLAITVPPVLVGGRGKHQLSVALAQNNSVLYRVPPASVAITVT